MKRVTLSMLFCIAFNLVGLAQCGFISIAKEYYRCNKADSNGKCSHEYKKYANEASTYMRKHKYSDACRNIKYSLIKAKKVGINLDTLYYLNAQILAAKGEYIYADEMISRMQVCVGEFSLYNAGIYALKSGLYEKAINCFTAHMASSKVLLHECHWGIGYAQLKCGRYDEAKGEFLVSIKIHENSNIRLGLVEIYMHKNNIDAAIDQLKILVLKDPSNRLARFYLINMRLNHCKPTNMTEFLSFLITDNSYEAMITKANLLYRNGNYVSAEGFYKRALNSSDNRMDAKIGLGNVYLARKKNDEAEKIFLQIISADPTNQYALEGIGIINFRKSNYSSALYSFKKAELLGEGFKLSYDALLCEGSIYLSQCDFNKAYACFNLAIGRSNKNGWAHAGIGFCLVNGRNFLYNDLLISKAKREFNIALKYENENPILLNYIGIAEYAAHLYKDAIIHFEKAIENGSTDTTSYNALAMAYCKVGKFDHAREMMTKVCQIAPTNPEFWNNSAIVECDYVNHILENNPEKNIEEALQKMDKYYNLALTMKADTAVILNNKGVGYFLAHKYDTALNIYNNITKADSLVNAAILNNIGVVFATTGNLKVGDINFQNANAIDADNNLSAIDINIELSNQKLFSFKRWFEKKFNYIQFYYMPSIPFAPQLNNEMNVPLVKVNISSPNEKQEFFKYNYRCDEHVSYSVKIYRSPSVKKIRKSAVDGCWNSK